MLLNLMIYVITVSFLLALAAWAFERAVRVFAFPTRWIWAGAMAGSLGYTLAATLRPTTSLHPLGTVVATPLDVLLIPVIGSITRLADTSPAGIGLEPLLGAGWVVLTLAVTAVLLRADARLRSDRSTWTPAELDGRDVLVSEDLGPGVVGWIRSVIVMPRWAFGMPPQERELMLQHEGEHCHAGDTRVAGLALLFLMLLPWNLPLWWQVHRLRVAIEIDCDHRVLQRWADVKRYARLLVEIGARGTAARLSALAFARPIPSIERRILAMTDTRDPRYIRTAGLTLLAVLLVVASCQVEQLSINIEVEQVTPDARAGAIDRAVRTVRVSTEEPPIAPAPGASAQIPSPQEARRLQVNPDLVRQQLLQSGLSESEIRAQLTAAGLPANALDQFLSGDSIQAERQTISPDGRWAAYIQELRPEDIAAIQAGPVFTPMTVAPEILNRTYVQQALMSEYPPPLRDAGIGGRVVVWFYISETGQVLDSRISESSGQAELDAAALKVAAVFQFTPAMNRGEPVPVWIQLPITFAVQN